MTSVRTNVFILYTNKKVSISMENKTHDMRSKTAIRTTINILTHDDDEDDMMGV